MYKSGKRTGYCWRHNLEQYGDDQHHGGKYIMTLIRQIDQEMVDNLFVMLTQFNSKVELPLFLKTLII